MSPLEAHVELMARNLQLSLMLAAVLTLGVAAFWRSAFVPALLLGIGALSALTIYLNGWPYFRIYFFSDASRVLARAWLPVAILLAAALIGLGLRALWRLLRGSRADAPT